MSGFPEQSFNEYEQRFFLAEILKTSPVSPNELLRFIQEREIQPRWNAMALPTGRSIDSCIGNFNQMLGFTRPPPPSAPPPPPLPQSAPGPGTPQRYEFLNAPGRPPMGKKRRPTEGQGQGHGPSGGNVQPIQAHPGAQPPMGYGPPPTGDMPIQARPSVPDPSMQPQFSHFAAVNESPSAPGAYHAGGQEMQGYGSDKKGKKRGRPSKADLEIAAAQAQARGEPWPPVKKMRKSAEGAAGAGDGGDGSSPRKKVARKPKSKPAPAEEPTSEAGSAPAPQMTADAPPAESPSVGGKQPSESEDQPEDKMQLDTPERQPRSTIPETQSSDFAATDSLLAGMQEQAAQSARPAQAAQSTEGKEDPQAAPTQAETVQSSNTLQQESARRSEEE